MEAREHAFSFIHLLEQTTTSIFRFFNEIMFGMFQTGKTFWTHFANPKQVFLAPSFSSRNRSDLAKRRGLW